MRWLLDAARRTLAACARRTDAVESVAEARLLEVREQRRDAWRWLRHLKGKQAAMDPQPLVGALPTPH